ncbi:hypothetical protein NHQ30_010162 [Ciborinia camelliae]|nr:hypothetical protein NHQ30_010162 [Ciborinia camelliae]
MLAKQRTETVSIYAVTSEPAVMLYTSGSSGTPKWIVLKHEGLQNWAEPLAQIYSFGTEVVLQQTSPAFDLSLMQILTALCLGGSLFIIPRQQRGDAKAIAEAIASNGVTFTCAIPSEYATWLQYGKQKLQDSIAWRKTFCAGESVPLSLVKQIKSLDKADLKFWNLYGPTEASLARTVSQIPLTSKFGTIAAGRPLPKYSVYVLDDRLRPVSIGMQGEIYIGGASVGLGYINKPELTATRFVANVFATPEDKINGWMTMHRPGDFGRWQENGELIIEGRIDSQIKLRGLRINFGEIEHNLLEASDGVPKEAVVSLRTSSPGKPDFLIAHVAFAETKNTKQHRLNAIKSELGKTLPQYMLSEHEEEYVVALTDTETLPKQVWQQVLGSQVKVTAKSDFFHNFDTDMPLISMFDSSTLNTMAQQIEGRGSKVQTQAIDWEAETSLSPALQI